MFLMRIGPPGQERPVVRVDNHHFVDVSDNGSTSIHASARALLRSVGRCSDGISNPASARYR